MVIKIIGSRDVSFKDSQSGDQITGKSLYYIYQDRNVEGNAADKIFIRSGINNPFEVGKRYNVSYNRYGRFDLDEVKEMT